MTTDLLRSSWTDVDPGELLFVILQRIGGPGQYDNVEKNPNTFYLPLAGALCRIKLSFSDSKQIVAIERGPSFDDDLWNQVVQDVESAGPRIFGRDCSFSGFRVTGSWRGELSGVQILPPPPDAPVPPIEVSEHPFILEFPLIQSDLWPITNFRRIRQHRQLTLLLNVLLAGGATVQPSRPRHLWAIVPMEGPCEPEVKWVQEYYFAKIGDVVRNELSPEGSVSLEVVDPETYYAIGGHDGGGLRVPADLDDSICCFTKLSRANRENFCRAGFWLDMAARQWTTSFSASFASLVIAIEALGERRPGAGKRTPGTNERFRNFIDRFAPGASLESRRKEMYALRSEILHGSGLMEMDQGAHFGWTPPERNEEELMRELGRLARIAIRNWLKNPTP